MHTSRVWHAACREDENIVAVDLITEHIRLKLQQHDLRRIYHNLHLTPSNFQVRGMHTIIRNRDTDKPDFVFYADRLLRLVRRSYLCLRQTRPQTCAAN
jgi:uridine kinase